MTGENVKFDRIKANNACMAIALSMSSVILKIVRGRVRRRTVANVCLFCVKKRTNGIGQSHPKERERKIENMIGYAGLCLQILIRKGIKKPWWEA